jgi:hypothetical protein
LKSTISNGKINSETVKSTNVRSKINICSKSLIIRKKILGVPCEICTAKMPPKSDLVEIGGRCFLESASCLILLYMGLIGLVLEYGSVCFTNMAKTHLLGLERVEYRALRVDEIHTE